MGCCRDFTENVMKINNLDCLWPFGVDDGKGPLWVCCSAVPDKPFFALPPWIMRSSLPIHLVPSLGEWLHCGFFEFCLLSARGHCFTASWLVTAACFVLTQTARSTALLLPQAMYSKDLKLLAKVNNFFSKKDAYVHVVVISLHRGHSDLLKQMCVEWMLMGRK